MDPMQDMTQKEKEEIRAKAIKFYNEHENYIIKLMNFCYVSHPPSSTEVFTPDLWSGSNWRWFVNTTLEQF